MNTEFEAKFININHEELLKSFESLDVVLEKSRTMFKRMTFDISNSPRGTFVRVRDEGGGKVTMTYKTVKELSVTGTQEIELEINDFDAAQFFLLNIGLTQASYEENYRTFYKSGDIELTIDEWPGIPPYLEIEGSSKENVIAMAEKLNLLMDTALFGTADEVYKHCGIDLSEFSKVTFESPPTVKS